MQKTKKLESLELLSTTSSGLDEIFHEEKSRENYIKFLGQLVRSENQELDQFLQENPHLLDSPAAKAIFIMNLILLKQKPMAMHISIRGVQPVIADSIAYELIELYKVLHENIKIDFINFYDFKDIMPTLVVYYSDFLLKDAYWSNPDEQDKYSEMVFKEINDDVNFEKLHDEDLKAQQHRLLALYYRRLGEDDKAENSLVQYRQGFSPNLSKAIKLSKIKAKTAYPGEEVLDHLDEIYQEISKIQAEVLDRSGVYRDTCFYYQCTDCCKKDFPTVSLTEFLHIKNWLEKNNIDIKPFIEKAKAIQEKHTKLYGEPLKVVDQTASSNPDENPHHMQFVCPFLSDDDICQVHEARPLACRSFGLATIDNESVQACKFYLTQYQFNSSHRNERDVYDSRDTTAIFGSSNSKLAKKHGYEKYRQPVGTLVAWLMND